MSLATTTSSLSYADIGIGSPAVLLSPEQWLVMSCLELEAGQSLRYSFAQMHLLAAAMVSGSGASVTSAPNADGLCIFPSSPAEVSQGRGMLWLGLYPSFDFTLTPSAQVSAEAVLAIPLQTQVVIPQFVTRGGSELTISAAGRYYWVLNNNTSNYNFSVLVSGQCRVTYYG
jgi:hypothetical protein